MSNISSDSKMLYLQIATISNHFIRTSVKKATDLKKLKIIL